MFDPALVEIANKVMAHCNADTTIAGLKAHYADNAVSIEATDLGGGNVVTEGREAIIQKHEWWLNAMEVHSSTLEGPFIHGDNKFSLIFEFDATAKETGERSKVREVGVYTVEGGKVVREEFFAPLGW